MSNRSFFARSLARLALGVSGLVAVSAAIVLTGAAAAPAALAPGGWL